VTLPDVSAAFLFLLGSPVSGPVNLAAPGQADVNTIVAALAHALHRPALLRVAAPVLRTVMPGLADELLLSSQRMEPAVLTAAGFTWQHGHLADAARWVTGKTGAA
jgi:NAD dependent epimerase/dehydratase family enzyme